MSKLNGFGEDLIIHNDEEVSTATFKVNNLVKVTLSIESIQNEKSSDRPQKWGASVPCCPRKL